MTKSLFFIILIVSSACNFAEESTCYGVTKNGRLKQGAQLPSKGANFISYSSLGEVLGRTYVHSTVKTIFIDAYKSLETLMPNKVYKYAETGYEEGGRFRPHKTHQNGLSIDFMVPVTNQKGESVHLSTHAFNKWGYSIELDSKGRYDNLVIDYEALAAHIVELHKSAIKQGVDIWRVIFAPELQPFLFQTKFGEYLKTNIQFNKQRLWVRHDEHYHVDFKVPCEKL